MSPAETEARRIVATNPKEIMSTPQWHRMTADLLQVIDDIRHEARVQAERSEMDR